MRRFGDWWHHHKGSVAWFVLVLLAALGFFRIQAVANQSNEALCNLRGDLQNRVEQTEKFLKHPEKFPAFNDPNTVALIQQQVKGQQRTIATLGGLPCS